MSADTYTIELTREETICLYALVAVALDLDIALDEKGREVLPAVRKKLEVWR